MENWPLWETFIRSQHGLAHKHVGSLHAPDAEMAVKNARDVYTRRNEGVSIWVVKSSDITASSPGEKSHCSSRQTAKSTAIPPFMNCRRRSRISNALFEFPLRLGDNCLILSQRLSEWCGHGPVLEEDIALANVALDLLGQARFWLSYAAEVEGAGRDEDKLAFLRDAGEFRNVLLVEQPNGDYAMTTARQFYFDTWHFHLLSALQQSTDSRIAAIAQKALKEVTYHLERSTDWIMRLGDGTEES